MRDKVKLLTEAAGFSSTYGAQEIERLEKLVLLVVEDCLRAVKETDTRHSYTTYDLGLIEATIDKSLENVCKAYDLPLHKYKRDANPFLDVTRPSRPNY